MPLSPWLPDGQINSSADFVSVQPLLQKYFCFSEMKIKLYDSPSRPTEGRIAIVTDAGRDAVDANGAFDESAGSGRRSRVVLTPQGRRQVGGVIRRRRCQEILITGESTKEPVKTIARGVPGDSGVTVVTTTGEHFYPFRPPGCGRIARPAFPAPFLGRAGR